ncbi:MAG: hypothetical protein ACFFDN_00055 [Candidatus Hodarchaeota archaeon]
MKERNEKNFYHLGNIDKTLAKLKTQNIEHLHFMDLNTTTIEDDDTLKDLWRGLLLKN